VDYVLRTSNHLLICRNLASSPIEPPDPWQPSDFPHSLPVQIDLSDAMVLGVADHEAVFPRPVLEMSHALRVVELCLPERAVPEPDSAGADHIHALHGGQVHNYESVVRGVSNHHEVLGLRVGQAFNVFNCYHFSRVVQVLSQSFDLLFSQL